VPGVSGNKKDANYGKGGSVGFGGGESDVNRGGEENDGFWRGGRIFILREEFFL